MKKIGKFAIGTAAALLLAASLPAAAATAGTGCWFTAARTACGVTAGLCRQDADGDGICDWRADGSCRYDADGDGICDQPGGRAGAGYGGGRGGRFA